MPASRVRFERSVLNALTVDVEDWFHDESRPEGPAVPAELAIAERRVTPNLEHLLDLFAARGARATLFFLGEVALEAPGLVREALRRGHEIACHGLRHRPVRGRSRAEFREDVRRARAILEDVGGVAVRGFRVPCFLRRADELWALDVLAEEGLRYDSSYMPIDYLPRRRRLAISELGARRLPSGLWEFPMPLSRVAGGHHLPCAAGGFVLRALPYAVTRRYLTRFNEQVGPAVIYTHPWELDPGSGKLRGTPAHIRLFNAIGRRRLPARLDRLLSEFRFAPIAEAYAAELRAS